MVVALVKTHDFEDSVMTDAQATIADWVNANEDVSLSIEALKVDCEEEIKMKAKRWGCSIRRIGASNFTPFDKVYCVVGGEEELLVE